MTRPKKSTSAFLIIIGGISLFASAAVLFFSNVHIGHFLSIAAGIITILTGVFFKAVPKWTKLALLTVLLLLTSSITVVAIYGCVDDATHQEDALIVLGAGIRGEEPGATLKGRLDAAVSYHGQNPDALIVVSGGQGPQEDITEAEAMKKYLVGHGVDEKMILLEPRATSSRENFIFSKELLDAHLGGDYTVAFITNEYHVFRAELTAKKIGLDNATHCHSNTPLYLFIPNTLRELLAIAKELILE